MPELLDRLYRVQEDGYAQWRACCPACCKNGRTLLIREASDGTMLLHCSSGCPPAQIVAAVGLDWTCLYPSHRHRRHAPSPGWWRERPRYERDPGPSGER